MKRKTATAIGIAALCAGGLLTPAATAVAAVPTAPTAATAPAPLAAAKFTLYRHDDFKGGHCSVTKSDKDLRNNDWIGAKNSCNNGASSMKNKTGHEVVLYDGKGYTGRTYYAKPHSEDRDLTNNGFDNKASAIRFR
ncbi:peptidase inhibitor family I36 protein [Streptomyces sp. NPDC047117]|uniref:peptidase inhibitor family I36 protein n=1 Tax=unclassified Streptomyces TaxID=2593676 RepID=UPI0033C76B24